MNILKLMDEYLEFESDKYEKETLKRYYLALENLYKNDNSHDVFELDFDSLYIVDKDASQYTKEYLLFEGTMSRKRRIDYQMFIHNEMVWLGYEDDYVLPRIEFLKVECVLDYTFEGDEWLLNNAEKDFNAKFFKPEKNMDEIHREALIENYEREICKLTKS